MTSAAELRFSLVVPIYNEEENVANLLAEIEAVLAPHGPFEAVVVDDCSKDRSLELMRAWKRERGASWLRIVTLEKNSGQSAAVMAGADAVQLVSELLANGPERLRTLREELAYWLADHQYDSLAELRGSMNLRDCPDPAAYERANYRLMLRGPRR